MLGIYLEELCHCYYHYEEDVLVKHKVIEILSSHIQDFQPTDWKALWNRQPKSHQK